MNIIDIIRLLPLRYRKKGIGVTLSAILQAILNFMGLTALVPLLVIILNPAKAEQSSILNKLSGWIQIQNTDSLVIIICILTFCFILFKNILSIKLGTLQVRYVNALYMYFSEELYKNFLQRGLSFIKTTNTQDLTHKINIVCYTFSQNVLLRYFLLIGDGALLVFILSGLFVYSWKLALLTLACFAPVATSYLFLVRRRLVKYGKAENEARRRQMLITSETFRGYAEIKINNASPMQISRFKKNVFQIARYRELSDRIMRIPGTVIETCMAGIMIVMVLIGRNDDEMKVAFGIFAVAALRLLPAVRNLITGWVSIKNNSYAADIIRDGINPGKKHVPDFEQNDKPVQISFRDKIEINNITFGFSDSGKENSPAIENFSATIHKGERVLINGASGAGKSTLFNLLLGLYMPQKGDIRIDGKLLDKTTCEAWHTLVGYVPQDVFLLEGTLAENIALGEAEINTERVIGALKQASLYTFADSLPEGIFTQVGENGCRLSGGQKQRVGIARALYKEAQVLFFDEATSSLDIYTEKEITNAIEELSRKNTNLTIILISHKEISPGFYNKVITLTEKSACAGK